MTTCSAQSPVGLIADIGGTNARFALVFNDGTTSHPVALKCRDHASPTAAARAYLAEASPSVRPSRGAFAVASAFSGDDVAMTNHAWRFSIEETRRALGLERLDVINDFVAVALAVPHLGDADKVVIKDGAADPHAPICVLGPGTGLGVSALVPVAGRWVALPGEGGHVTMPACTDREAAIIAWLHAKYGHPSAERLLSGPGLVNIHDALRALSGQDPQPVTPADLSGRALAGEPLAKETLGIFFSMLGTMAGNTVLTMGARGGVVLAGGILPQVLGAFLASDFVARFLDKGRFANYLAPVPIALITHPFPAFLGLAGLAVA